jgi:hypothetical protein
MTEGGSDKVYRRAGDVPDNIAVSSRPVTAAINASLVVTVPDSGTDTGGWSIAVRRGVLRVSRAAGDKTDAGNDAEDAEPARGRFARAAKSGTGRGDTWANDVAGSTDVTSAQESAVR